MGELDEALESFEKCAALTPEYLMARYHIGVIYERMERWEEAAREFRRAADEVVEDVSSLYHLAECHRHLGDEAAAAKTMERVRQFRRAGHR